MVERVRLLVGGHVQGVGYRALVKDAARRLGVKGCAKNLEDGSVEIYCEASSKEILARFVKQIDVQSAEDERGMPNVTSIQAFPEKVKEFKPVDNAFRLFWIDFGDNLSTADRELLERTGTGGLILQDNNRILKRVDKNVIRVGEKVDGVGIEVKGVGSKVEEVSDEVKKVGTKVEEVGDEVKVVGNKLNQFAVNAVDNFKGLNTKVNGFAGNTTQNFQVLDRKYGKLSVSLTKINSNLEKLVAVAERVAGKIVH